MATLQDWNRVELALLLDLLEYLGVATLAQVLGRPAGEVTAQARALRLLPAAKPARRPKPAAAQPAPVPPPPPVPLKAAALSTEDRRQLKQKAKAKAEQKRTRAVEARKPKKAGLSDHLRTLPYNHPERAAYRNGGLKAWEQYHQQNA